MHTDLGRERDMIPGAWVASLLSEKSLDPMAAAVLTKKHLTTIYKWQKRGIEYLDWCGLLHLLDEPADWQPKKSRAK